MGWYGHGGVDVDEVLSHKMGGKGTPRYLSEEQDRVLAGEVSTGCFKTRARLEIG